MIAGGVKVEGAKEAVVRLRKYAVRLDDWRALWPEITEAFTRREELWFTREGEGTWPALSDQYAQWKAIIFPGQPILTATGELRASLTDPGKAVLAQTDTMLVLGSADPKAKYHQHGTGKMPARPPLIPTLRLEAAIARLLRRHVAYRPYFGEVA